MNTKYIIKQNGSVVGYVNTLEEATELCEILNNNNYEYNLPYKFYFEEIRKVLKKNAVPKYTYVFNYELNGKPVLNLLSKEGPLMSNNLFKEYLMQPVFTNNNSKANMMRIIIFLSKENEKLARKKANSIMLDFLTGKKGLYNVIP